MYAKIIIDGYVAALSDGGGEPITETEYNEILSAVRSRPTAPEGYQYILRADTLEWELAELPPVEPEPPTDEEAITRYTNSLTGASDPDLISAAETLIKQRIKEDS